jgi:hypothetical protein
MWQRSAAPFTLLICEARVFVEYIKSHAGCRL